jgi:class 3 adenylate cyclase
MVEQRSTAAHACVVFLRIREFSGKPAAERAELKKRLDDAVASGSADLKDGERIFLDAPDAAAVVILGNPRGAVRFANESSASLRDTTLGIGLNHGPVRVVRESGTGPILVGDGINVASTIADLGPSGRILASRSFRDYLLALAPDRGRYLAPAGAFADREDRPHELYLADDRSLADRRRRFLIVCGLAAGGLLALGVAGRYALDDSAAIELEIKPEGEVFVDGVFKGMAPPLARLELAPGKHTIEVRNPRFKSLVVEVDVKRGEQLSLRHSFTAAAGSKSAIRRFFDRFK